MSKPWEKVDKIKEILGEILGDFDQEECEQAKINRDLKFFREEIETLESQNKKLIEALRFYEDIHEDLLDGGKRARVALKELIMNKSIPCELCCSNIIKGFMTKLKKEDPKDEDRFVCELCVTEIELAQLVWIYDGECK